MKKLVYSALLASFALVSSLQANEYIIRNNTDSTLNVAIYGQGRVGELGIARKQVAPNTVVPVQDPGSRQANTFSTLGCYDTIDIGATGGTLGGIGASIPSSKIHGRFGASYCGYFEIVINQVVFVKELKDNVHPGYKSSGGNRYSGTIIGRKVYDEKMEVLVYHSLFKPEYREKLLETQEPLKIEVTREDMEETVVEESSDDN